MPEQISYFADWSYKDFWIWLSAFVEGEGCIHIGNKRGLVEITIANTNRDVIESIGLRLGFGEINETRFSKLRWKTKYAWRTRRWKECRTVLAQMIPYLTFKREKAIAALEHLAWHTEEETRRVLMQDEAKRLRALGRTQRQIAAALGIGRWMVQPVLDWRMEQPETLRRCRSRVSNQTKAKAQVTTGHATPRRIRAEL